MWDIFEFDWRNSPTKKGNNTGLNTCVYTKNYGRITHVHCKQIDLDFHVSTRENILLIGFVNMYLSFLCAKMIFYFSCYYFLKKKIDIKLKRNYAYSFITVSLLSRTFRSVRAVRLARENQVTFPDQTVLLRTGWSGH